MAKGSNLKTHGLSHLPIYRKWEQMKNRLASCHKVRSNKCYQGIKCKWPNFTAFYKDMNESFLSHVKKYGIKETSLDRIDNSKNYSVKNCRWVTKAQQAKNQRRVRFVVNKGKIYYISDLQIITGYGYRTILQRINEGWLFKEIIKIKPKLGNNQSLRI